jgi:hypothetical protein
MRFLRPLLGVRPRDNANTDVRKQVGTELTVDETQEYQRKWHNHVERKRPERLLLKEHFYNSTEDGHWTHKKKVVKVFLSRNGS